MTVIKTRRHLIDGRLMSRIDTSSLRFEAGDQLIDPDGFKEKKSHRLFVCLSSSLVDSSQWCLRSAFTVINVFVERHAAPSIRRRTNVLIQQMNIKKKAGIVLHLYCAFFGRRSVRNPCHKVTEHADTVKQFKMLYNSRVFHAFE